MRMSACGGPAWRYDAEWRMNVLSRPPERGARELRESHVLTLQEIAIREIYLCGGRY